MRLFCVAALLLALSPGCRCGSSAGGGTAGGFGEGRATGPQGVKIPLGGPGRLGYLAFTDDGGFIAEERPLLESAATRVHLFDPAGKARGTVTVQRAAMRLSRDGKVLGTASSRRVLSLWDAHDGKLLKQWSASRPLRDVLFSPDGAHVADLDDGGAVRIWDIASGQRVARLVDGEVETPSFAGSEDGRTLVVGRSFGQRIWNLAASTVERSEGEDAGNQPLVSHDGRFIVSARPNRGGIALTDRQTQRTTTAAAGELHVLSPDGTKLAAEDSSHSLVLIELATNTRLAELRGACRPLISAAFSPDGSRLVASSEDGSARMWEVASGRELAGWHLPPDCGLSFNPPITAVAWSDDGQSLLLGFYEKWLERVTLTPALASGPRPKTALPPALVPPPGAKRAVAFGDSVATFGPFSDAQLAPASTADAWTMAVAEDDGTARLFQAGGTEEPVERATLGEPGGTAATHVAWAAQGQVLAVAQRDGRVQWVDLDSRQVLATVSVAPGGAQLPGAVPRWSVHRRGLRGTRIQVWKRDGTLLRELEGHTPVEGRENDLTAITSLVFAADGKTLYSGSNDFYNASHGDLRRWNVETGEREQLGDVAYLSALALSADGAMLATGEDKKVVVRDLRTNQTRHTLRGHTGRVQSTAFLPDGLTLASADDDSPTVRLWDLTSGQELAKLESDGQRCNDARLSVSENGQLLAAVFHCFGSQVRLISLAGLRRPPPVTAKPELPKAPKPPPRKPERKPAFDDLFK